MGLKFNSLFCPFQYGDLIGYGKCQEETNDQEGERGEKKETQRETLEEIDKCDHSLFRLNGGYFMKALRKKNIKKKKKHQEKIGK